MNIILYHYLSLNTNESLICQIYQHSCNRLKNETHPIKDTSLDSLALNPLDVLPKQNGVGKLSFLFSALNLKIYFSLTSK